MTETPFGVRLSARADNVGLFIRPQDAAQLVHYFELLRHWNRTINLTGLPLDPPSDEAIDRLFIEPLAAARVLEEFAPRHSPSHVPVLGVATWADLGSGGGSPAIPMKILMPSVFLTMIESKSRKAAFLREAIRSLRLDGATVEHMRFEEIRNHPAVDLVTVRAVRIDADLSRVAESLLDEKGRFLIFDRHAAAPSLPGFDHPFVKQLLSERHSWLHIYARMFHVEQ